MIRESLWRTLIRATDELSSGNQNVKFCLSKRSQFCHQIDICQFDFAKWLVRMVQTDSLYMSCIASNSQSFVSSLAYISAGSRHCYVCDSQAGPSSRWCFRQPSSRSLASSINFVKSPACQETLWVLCVWYCHLHWSRSSGSSASSGTACCHSWRSVESSMSWLVNSSGADIWIINVSFYDGWLSGSVILLIGFSKPHKTQGRCFLLQHFLGCHWWTVNYQSSLISNSSLSVLHSLYRQSLLHVHGWNTVWLSWPWHLTSCIIPSPPGLQLFAHADDSSGRKAVSIICVSVCLFIRTIKPKRLKLQLQNLL